MKLIQLTQPNGTIFYLNPSYIIRIRPSDSDAGSELFINGNPVNIFVTETPQDILTLINQQQ